MPISLRLADKAGTPATGAKRTPAKEKDAFSPEGTPQTHPPEPIGKNRRILVVDDNPVVLKAFELKLKSDGFAVSTTTNSAAVASTAERDKSELVVLDINFPPGGAIDWNGFTVMQWLRRFPELARIPVILISGSDASEYRDKALAAGAVAFFQKPVSYKEILEVILKTLAGAPSQVANEQE